MALYDTSLPPTAYFRPPQYRQGNALIDKYGKSTLLGEVTAVGLPILGAVGGALIGGPAGAAIGGEAGKLGAQLLAQGAGSGRTDDSADEAQAAVGKQLGLSTIAGKVTDLATPFLGKGGGKPQANTGGKLTPPILPPVPGASSPAATPTLPTVPARVTSTGPGLLTRPAAEQPFNLLSVFPPWNDNTAAQNMFGSIKPPRNSVFFR